ncbi:hypothetical protein OIO90_005598 [Microbotryomycetes sp. JL221]|nr:hypothetical protein OIO90_005598 [Microbotryomycetes sp. JL221]
MSEDEYDAFFDDLPEDALELAESAAQASSTQVAVKPQTNVEGYVQQRTGLYQGPKQRPKPTILRPPQNPPPRLPPVEALHGRPLHPTEPVNETNSTSNTGTKVPGTSTAQSGPPPSKKARLDLPDNPALGRNKEWINPNPFAISSSSSTAPKKIESIHIKTDFAKKPVERDNDEEEMPEITLAPNGTYVTNRPDNTVTKKLVQPRPPDAPPLARDLTALKEWGQRPSTTTASSKEGATTGELGGVQVGWATGYISGKPDDAEPEHQKRIRLELEMAKKEKQEMQALVKELRDKLKEAENMRLRKEGETSIVRRKLDQMKKEHDQREQTDQKMKEILQSKLKEKENEFRKLQDNFKINEAFRRQETETSFRRPGNSQWSSARRPSVTSAAAPPGLASPSANRSKSKGPTRAFPGFQSAFDNAETAQANETNSQGKNASPSRAASAAFSTPEKARAETRLPEPIQEDNENTEREEEAWKDVIFTEEAKHIRFELTKIILVHRTFVPEIALHSTHASKNNQSAMFARLATTLSPRTAKKSSKEAVEINRSSSKDDSSQTRITSVATLQYLSNAGTKLSNASSQQIVAAQLRNLLVALGVYTDPSSNTFSRETDVEPLCQLLDLIATIAHKSSNAAETWVLALVYDDSMMPAHDSEMLGANGPVNTPTLVEQLSHIAARLCGPPSSLASKSDKASSQYKTKERARRVRSLNSSRHSVTTRAGRRDASANAIELSEGASFAVTNATLSVLEALAWHAGEYSGQLLEKLTINPEAFARLLDSRHPTVILRRTMMLLCMLARRADLFRYIAAIPLGQTADVRGSKMPIFDRVASLLLRPGTSAGAVEEFALDRSLTTFVTIMSTKHADSITLITSTLSFLPSLICKIFDDVTACWDKDGLYLSDHRRILLELAIERMSANVHLLYYLVCAPHSNLHLGEFFAHSTYATIQDQFYSSFGTLAFANAPLWVETNEALSDKLVTLSDLAQDILEDVCPNELDDIAECFQLEEDEDVDGNNGQAADHEYDGMLDDDDDEVLAQMNLAQDAT